MPDKIWYKSFTLWGGILMLAGIVLSQFGYTITAEEQTQMAQQLVTIATAIGELSGMIMLVIGRRKAGKEIKMLRQMKRCSPMGKDAGLPQFFIRLFEQMFGKAANAVFSVVMFGMSADGKELIEAIKKSGQSENGKILIEQFKKLGKEEKPIIPI